MTFVDGASRIVDGTGAGSYRPATVRQIIVSRIVTAIRRIAEFAEQRRAPRPWVGTIPRCLILALVAVCLIVTSACQSPTSTFQIVDHRKSGKPERYHETFAEAFYDVDAGGQVDIVLRRSQRGVAQLDSQLTQVLHIRTVWQSIPGVTVADSTQINATVSYLIVGTGVGATFEGAGSVFFEENRGKNRLKGEVELALLQPTRRLAGSNAIFDSAQIKGSFTAVRDRRRVVRMLHEMNRLFGPLPPYQESTTVPF